MTPEQLAASGTESGHQRALFAAVHATLWQLACQKAHMGQPSEYGVAAKWDGIDRMWAEPLEWFHAIPNGGSRGDDARSRAIRGAALRAEGVKAGIADTFLPYPCKGFHGLYIEMKKPGAAGKASQEQLAFGSYARQIGYVWCVCDTWDKAFAALSEYLRP